MTKIPPKCPSCGSQLVVTQLGCTHCDTAIIGHYPLSPFLRLSEDSLRFLETFVRNRGNIKEMERELGQSYWTLRSQLDKIIGEMGFEVSPDEESLSNRRKEILEQLGQGEIDAEEAARQLSALGGN